MDPIQDAQLFGGYRLSSRLATGGMAEVYLARKLLPNGRWGHQVAVKRLLPHLLRDTHIIRMFLNEAKITAQISHPNVVRILDIGQQDGEPFIAMELLEGHSFAELRQKAAALGERVPLGITLRILADSCRGLDAAHKAVDQEGKPLSIVHRDFAPDNIHVGVNGVVKVIDFGIAKAENIGSGTEPGTLKGKFYYMSPEMILGKPVDHRADLFAAGVMLYEQLCGRRPFGGDSTEIVLTRIAEGRPRRPSQFDQSVPRELEEICMMALSRNPDERFVSLAVFIDAIEAVGGKAELASVDDVAAYMRRIWPIEQDARRQAFHRAVELDPSQPAMTAPSLSVRVVSTPAHPRRSPVMQVPIAAPQPQAPPAAPAPVEQVQPPEEPEAPESPEAPEAPSAQEATARGGPPRAFWLAAVVVLIAAGAGAAFVFWPRLPPSERLAKAEAESRPEKRAAILKPIAGDERATKEELVKAGRMFLEAGANQDALAVAEALAKRFDNPLEAALIEAKASIAVRAGKRAEAAIARAAQLAPTSAEPDVLAADLRLAQGDTKGAIEALRRARGKARKDANLAYRLGYLMSQEEDLDGAADALSAALASGFRADAATELAFVRFRQDRNPEAQSLLERVVKERPDDFTANYYLGAVLFRATDLAGAERAYRHADQVAPEDPRALAALCEMFAKGELPDRAEELKKEIGQRFPKQAAGLISRCVP